MRYLNTYQLFENLSHVEELIDILLPLRDNGFVTIIKNLQDILSVTSVKGVRVKITKHVLLQPDMAYGPGGIKHPQFKYNEIEDAINHCIGYMEEMGYRYENLRIITSRGSGIYNLDIKDIYYLYMDEPFRSFEIDFTKIPNK